MMIPRNSNFLIVAFCAAFACVALSLAPISSPVRAEGSAASKKKKKVDKAAQQLVALVQAFYDQTSALEASFVQKQYTRVYDKTSKAKGKVIFAKPGKMRWDYADPKGQVLSAHDSKLYFYEPPDEGEKYGQLIERDIDDAQLPSVFGFLMGNGKLKDDFRARMVKTKRKLPKGVSIVELRPKKSSPHYKKLYFYVRLIKKGDARAALVRRILIIDTQGNRNQFDLRKLKFPKKIADKKFEFVPPKGTPRVTN